MPYFISIFCHSAASLVNSPPTGVCNKPLTRNHQSRTIRESITPMPRPQSTQISRPVTRQRTSQVCSGLGSFWFCLKSKEPVFVKNAYGGGNNPQSFPLPPQIIFYSMVQKDLSANMVIWNVGNYHSICNKPWCWLPSYYKILMLIIHILTIPLD